MPGLYKNKKPFFLFFSLLLVLTSFVSAQPYLIDQQGVLRNATNGTIMRGSHDFTFYLYNISNDELVYNESTSINVRNGVWNYLIGLDQPIPEANIKSSFNNLYIRTQIDGNILGKANITIVPWAFYAINANSTDYFNGQSASYYATATSVTNLQTTVANIATNQTNITTLINNITRRIDALNGSIGIGSDTDYLNITIISDQLSTNFTSYQTQINNLATNETNITYRLKLLNDSIGVTGTDDSITTNLNANISSANASLWARVIAQGYLTSITDTWTDSLATNISNTIDRLQANISALSANTAIHSNISNNTRNISNVIGLIGALATNVTRLNDSDTINQKNISEIRGLIGSTTSGGGTNMTFYYNKTTISFNGSLVNGSLKGYVAGDMICNVSFAGTHLCQQSEIIQTITYRPIATMEDWVDDAWMSTGAPKYAPATTPVNDCNGFTSGTTSYLGSYWHFNQTTGGDGRAIHCGTTLPLACCKVW